MNYCKINNFDIANGEGVRVSLFVSGCCHQCFGCFNKEAWDYNYGELFTSETEQQIIQYLNQDYISGLTLLGGEPLAPKNLAAVTALAKKVKSIYPNKTIWLYTGYVFEEISCLDIIEFIDIIIDGPFILSKKDLTLKFRGSSNQRIINVKKSLEENKIIVKE